MTTEPVKPSTKTTNYRNLGSKSLNRSWWRHWVYPLLFLLAMVLSLSTYLTLDSIQQSVRDYVTDNQRALVGGDLILNSKQAWTPDILEAVQAFESDAVSKSVALNDESIESKGVVYDYQFNAMVSSVDAHEYGDSESDEKTLLARLKAISNQYPLYGDVELASGKPLWQQLQPNTVVVETQVLTGLELTVGNKVKIGDAVFTIADEIVTEPDRPLTAFGFGARVLMSDSDLQATNLMGQRSRVNYRIELAGDSETIATEYAKLEQITEALPASQEVELTTADESDNAVTEVSDNVLMFLKLLVIAVLFLSAVALLSVVKAFVGLQQNTNAIRRALGESVRSIKRSYYLLFLRMAVLACVTSGLLSLGMLNVGAQYLTAILPPDINLSIKLVSLAKISIVALVITILVVQQSLYAVTHTKPSAVLKQSASDTRQYPPLYWYGLVLLASYGLLAYEFGSLMTGLQVLGGMLVLAGSFWLLGKSWLWLLAKLIERGVFGKKSGWMARIAVHNLSRKGNQSGLFFVTLALSVAVLTMITLLNHSLNKQFVQAYPEDAPNLFLLDVQSDQHDTLNTMIDSPITYYPVVRARVSEAGGVAADEIVVSQGEGDDPTRVFNLSYADSVMDTEFIKESVEPDQLYAPIASDTQANNEVGNEEIFPLSILDSAAELLNVDMGDQIRFNIQGIEIVGQITSIRERYERGPSPFFYFLFPPEVLADAPQIQFATTTVDSDSIPQLQTDLVRAFPAITTIDGGAIAKQVQGFVAQMSRLVQVFTLLAMITGIMVLITSLLSTSQDRLRDSASFRLLGMQTRDLYRINMLEIGLLGLSAGAFAVLLASATAYVIITQWFNLRFSVPWASLAIGAVLLVAVLLIIAIGYVRLVIGRGIMARVRGMV